MSSPQLVALAERARVQPPMKRHETFIICWLDDREVHPWPHRTIAALVADIASGEIISPPVRIVRFDDDCPPKDLDLTDIAELAWDLLAPTYEGENSHGLPKFLQRHCRDDLDERIASLNVTRAQAARAGIRAVAMGGR